MKFLRMRLKNFMTFGDQYQQLKFSKRGLVLIEAENHDDPSSQSNGAGKSALIDALVWCLYGVTTHEPPAEADDVVNRFTGKNCIVEVTFEHNDTIYMVVRYRKLKDHDGIDEATKEHGLVFHRGETPLTKSTTKETQAEIERVLGMSVTTFRHAVVFGQSKAFRFNRLTDAEKKAVLDEMTGAEVYAIAADLAGKELSVQEDAYETHTRLAKTSYQNQLDAEERLKKLRDKRAAAKAERDQTLLEAKAMLQLKKDKLAKLDPVTKHDVQHQSERVTKLRNTIDAMRDNEDTIRANVVQAKQAVVTAQEKNDAVHAKIKEIKKREVCEACEQPIDPKHAKKQVDALRKKLDTDMGLWPVDKQHVVDELEKELEKAKEKRKALVEERDAAQKAYEELREKKTRYEALEDQVKNAQQLYDRAVKADPKDFDDLIAADETAVKVAKMAHDAHVEDAEAAAQKQKMLEFWRDGFSAKGLRSLMLDSVLPFLNSKLQQYSNAVTARTIKVEFRTQRGLKSGSLREDFHVHVENEHGANMYSMLSIGERAKVDLIVGLALQDFAAAKSRIPVNVAFFDEPFDGLDATAMDRVMDLLTSVLKKRESVFIITHEQTLKTYISKTVCVVKKDNNSTIQ